MAWSYTNVPSPGATVAANYESLFNSNLRNNGLSQGLGGKLIIATLVKDSGDATEAQLLAAIKTFERAGGDGTGTDTGGPDAFTVVGFSWDGSTDASVYVALQGTGTLGSAPSGYTITEVVTFNTGY
jgi:hypothetical protein